MISNVTISLLLGFTHCASSQICQMNNINWAKNAAIRQSQDRCGNNNSIKHLRDCASSSNRLV